MRKKFDVQLPIFIPLWRRIVLVVFTFSWAVLEFSWGNPGWSVLFAVIGTYLAHQFFVAFDPPKEDPHE